MWNFEYSAITEAKAKTIWDLYSNIETWKEWDEEIENVQLFGEFKEGTKGTLKMRGQEEVEYVLVEVKPLQLFSNITDIPGAGISIKFLHKIEPVENGTKVTHTMIITGSNTEILGPQIGERISQGIPYTVTTLIQFARKIELQCQ